MGNMDPYIDLSMQAHNAGGPAELLEQVFQRGNEQGFSDGQMSGLVRGVIVGAVFTAGVTTAVFWPALRERLGPKRGDDLSAGAEEAIAKAAARNWCTVTNDQKFKGGLALLVGDRFRALTRSGGVVQIQVDGRDEAYYAPGADLESISDFVLEDIDEL